MEENFLKKSRNVLDPSDSESRSFRTGINFNWKKYAWSRRTDYPRDLRAKKVEDDAAQIIGETGKLIVCWKSVCSGWSSAYTRIQLGRHRTSAEPTDFRAKQVLSPPGDGWHNDSLAGLLGGYMCNVSFYLTLCTVCTISPGPLVHLYSRLHPVHMVLFRLSLHGTEDDRP